LGPERANAFEAVFSASSETILEVAARQGIRPGVLAVHTWTQKQQTHPHTHCLVTGGGLGQDGFLHRRRYLFPIKVLRYVFKIKLLQKLRRLLKQGRLNVARESPSPTAVSSATTGTPSSSAIATAKTVIALRPPSSTGRASAAAS